MPLSVKIKLGTKAETLERLQPQLSQAVISKINYFRVGEYLESPNRILSDIKSEYVDGLIIVRSSSLTEDGAYESMAGAFKSFLNVDGQDCHQVKAAIDKVISSYSGDPNDQVLIQPMIEDIAMSGVVLTRDLDSGAPYYVINYDDESGLTDSVTGGTGVNKTVLIFRNCGLSKIHSDRIRRVVQVVREVEKLCPSIPLDIEFGVTHSEICHVFQVRPMTHSANWKHDIEEQVSGRLGYVEQFIRECSRRRSGLVGHTTIFGEMPDWNPAEIIGTKPRPLAASLYREIITRSVWREAREEIGYRRLPGEELMVMIGGRPFIDVRNSFNSFLPSGLDDEISEKLINAWLKFLCNNPHLHDKVEFGVAQTCVDFNFKEDFEERYADILTDSEFEEYSSNLLALTQELLRLDSQGSLLQSMTDIDTLHSIQKSRVIHWSHLHGSHDILTTIRTLLLECRSLGTKPFSILARHGFIAESLLQSAVRKGALGTDRLKAFKRSVHTITSEFAHDLGAVAKGVLIEEDFIAKYGHLRPGTYDIMSLRYADRKHLFDAIRIPENCSQSIEFSLTLDEHRDLNKLLKAAGFTNLSPEQLMIYSRQAIAGREYGKFTFTRNLSDAIEGLAEWGNRLGISRDEMSYLELDDVMNLLTRPVLEDVLDYLTDRINAGRHQVELASALRMSFLIRDPDDVYVVPLYRSAPNFIGSTRLEAELVELSARSGEDVSLTNRIVCIENADPGFDWIFTKGISGLITKYGGANSHMAIRCAEFGLPAAIGCGDQIFERLVQAGQVELNCESNVLRPLYAD